MNNTCLVAENFTRSITDSSHHISPDTRRYMCEVGLILSQRRRQWANIKLAFCKKIMNIQYPPYLKMDEMTDSARSRSATWGAASLAVRKMVVPSYLLRLSNRPIYIYSVRIVCTANHKGWFSGNSDSLTQTSHDRVTYVIS